MLERIVERCDVALVRNIDGCRPLYLVSFQLNVNEPQVRMGHCEVTLQEVAETETASLPQAIDLTRGYDSNGVEPVETTVRVNGMPNLIGKVVTYFPLGAVVHPHYALALA